MKPKAIVLLSGGMDSTTLLYTVLSQGYDAAVLSVHYGQRHKKELEYAMATTRQFGLEHKIIDLSALTPIISRSVLTSDSPVPDGHYSELTMAQTVVPNRNAILLAIAFGFAITREAKMVATAVHAGDHFIYPDCRPEFVQAFEAMENVAIDRAIYGIPAPKLYAPFVMMTKAEICEKGQQLGVPWSNTWSCYKGGEIHCGTCGTCVERIEAFKIAKVEDPTQYEDIEGGMKILKEKGSPIAV